MISRGFFFNTNIVIYYQGSEVVGHASVFLYASHLYGGPNSKFVSCTREVKYELLYYCFAYLVISQRSHWATLESELKINVTEFRWSIKRFKNSSTEKVRRWSVYTTRTNVRWFNVLSTRTDNVRRCPMKFWCHDIKIYRPTIDEHSGTKT